MFAPDEELPPHLLSSTFLPTSSVGGTAAASISDTKTATTTHPLSDSHSSILRKRKAMDKPGVLGTYSGDVDESDDAVAVRKFANHAGYRLSIDCNCGGINHHKLHVPCRFDALMKESHKKATTISEHSIDDDLLRVWVLLCGYDDSMSQNPFPNPPAASRSRTKRRQTKTAGAGTGTCSDHP